MAIKILADSCCDVTPALKNLMELDLIPLGTPLQALQIVGHPRRRVKRTGRAGSTIAASGRTGR